MEFLFFKLLAIMSLTLIVQSSDKRLKRSDQECGVVRKDIFGSRIEDGEFFERATWPWMVALIHNKANRYFCSGTFVLPNKVLTAAHCVKNKHSNEVLKAEDVTMLFGAHNLDIPYEPGAYGVISEEIFIHPEWNTTDPRFDADIAIMMTGADDIIPRTKFIQPICLWDKEQLPDISKGTIAGWGSNHKTDSSKGYEPIPQQLEVPIIDQESCFLDNPNHARVSSKRTFCAGYKNQNRGPCTGDSGAGLYIEVNSVFCLKGIVSSSLYDKVNNTYKCDVNNPSIYTNVFKFIDWIKDPSHKPNPVIIDPSFGDIFNTGSPQLPYIHPDEYVQPENKQDEFDWNLTKRFFMDNQEKNLIFSPIGSKLMLTLLAEAVGQEVSSNTRKELEAALPYNKNLYGAKEYFAKVLNSLGTNSDDYRIVFGTKFYVDEDVSVNQRFGAIAKHNYLTDVESLNFVDSRSSNNLINGWLKEILTGKFNVEDKDYVNSDSVIFLINAMFFEGKWRYPFERTVTRRFIDSRNKNLNKRFLEQTGNFNHFSSIDLDSKILRLPYKGHRFSLFIILPNQLDGLNQVLGKLESNLIRNEVLHMNETEVYVLIPKFKLDYAADLKDVLKKTGIREIFENNAKFPKLARGGNSEGPLKVAEIIQKSIFVFEDNETTRKSSQNAGGEAEEFIADHPFLFYIEDDTTGAKVLSGIVNDPQF